MKFVFPSASHALVGLLGGAQVAYLSCFQVKGHKRHMLNLTLIYWCNIEQGA